MKNRLETAHQFVNDIWQFYKKHTGETNWKAAIEDAEKLDEQYGNNTTMHNIILEVIDGLQREENERKNQSNN